MKQNRWHSLINFLLAALVVTACATPAAHTTTPAPPTSTTLPPTATILPSDTPIPPTNTTTPTKTPPPTRTPLLTATQEALNQQATATEAVAYIHATATQMAQWPSVFSSTFDKNGQGWWAGKVNDKFSKGEVTIADGVYQFDLTAKKAFYWTATPEMRSVSDFSISVEARQNSGSADNDYGLIFRQTDDKNFYYFAVDNSQQFALLQVKKGEWNILMDWKKSAAIQTNKTNRLAVNATGTHFDLFINDVWVGEHSDAAFAKGKAGVLVDLYNPDDHAVFVFDNFIVHASSAVATSGGGGNSSDATPQPGATPDKSASVYSSASGGPQGYTSYLICTQVDGSPCQAVMSPGDISFAILLQSGPDALLAIFLPFGLSVEKDGANAADMYMTVDAGWLPPDSQARFGTSHRFTQPGHYIIRTNGCLMTEASYPSCSWWTVNGTVVTFDIQP